MLVLEDDHAPEYLESKLDLAYGRRARALSPENLRVGTSDSLRNATWRASFAELADIPEPVLQPYEDTTGARVYVEACLLLGVRVRMCIVQQLQSTDITTAIICDHYALNAKGVVRVHVRPCVDVCM